LEFRLQAARLAPIIPTRRLKMEFLLVPGYFWFVVLQRANFAFAGRCATSVSVFLHFEGKPNVKPLSPPVDGPFGDIFPVKGNREEPVASAMPLTIVQSECHWALPIGADRSILLRTWGLLVQKPTTHFRRGSGWGGISHDPAS
jgi:hypothetical protein